jgi:hypothetical protein
VPIPASTQTISKANLSDLRAASSLTWWGNGSGPTALFPNGRIMTWEDIAFYVGHASAAGGTLTRAPTWGVVSPWHVPSPTPQILSSTNWQPGFSASEIYLQWTANGLNNIQDWLLTRGGGSFVLGAATTSYTDSTATEDTQYTYTLVARKARTRAGQAEVVTSAPQTLNILSRLRPNVPGQSSVSGSSATVGWTPQSTTRNAFEILRSTDVGQTWTVVHNFIDTDAGNHHRSWTDFNVLGGTTYFYRVVALRTNGNTVAQGQIVYNTSAGEACEIELSTPVGIPTNVTSYSAGNNHASTSWSGNVPSGWRFRIQRGQILGLSNPETWDDVATTTVNGYDDLTVGQGTFRYRVRAEKNDLTQFTNYAEGNDVVVGGGWG